MTLLIGVDVQGNELIVALRRNGAFLPPSRVVVSAPEVLDIALQQRQDTQEQIVIAIDAPRHYLTGRRLWNLGHGGEWVAADKARGRHCEVVVRRLRLANPQWTPHVTQPIPWITLGQQLFTAFESHGFTAIECFPTASYTRFGRMDNTVLEIPGGMFAHSRLAHDVLDACVAALTAEFYVAGNATELGGGDGYGTIIVPGILEVPFGAFPT